MNTRNCPPWCRMKHGDTPLIHHATVGTIHENGRPRFNVAISQDHADVQYICVFNNAADDDEMTRFAPSETAGFARLMNDLGRPDLSDLVRKAAGVLAGTHCPACGNELTEFGGTLMCLADAEQGGGEGQ